MRLLEYAWSTATAIARKEYEALRLILDEGLDYPLLGTDVRGYVLLVPIPRKGRRDQYFLHGLGLAADDSSWRILWKLFKASLYHLSFHAAYSDFRAYAAWGRGKELRTAAYSISLVEDYRITLLGAREWPGLVEDIAYANYISRLRAKPPEEIEDDALRFSMLLLLSLWGLFKLRRADPEQLEVERLAHSIRGRMAEAIERPERAREMVLAAAQEVYAAVAKRGYLSEVPVLPYADQRGECGCFRRRLPEAAALEPAKSSLPQVMYRGQHEDQNREQERQEALQVKSALEGEWQRRERLYARYGPALLATRLKGLEFPRGDYGNFLRIRASLAGPIRTIKDQLRQIRQSLDVTRRHESGEVELEEAMQALASMVTRNDVFARFEPRSKEEAWAILIDASKSAQPFSYEARGLATCLAEMASELIRKDLWGLFAFNNKLHIIKDFEDSYDMESKARIGGFKQGGATLLPDAIEVCSRALVSRPAETKILVVASDGEALGYEGIERKLIETLKKVSSSGILLFGIGIRSDELASYFLVNSIMQEPYQLMRYFAKSYLQLSSLF